MADIFINVFNLSVTASWIVLAVVILRPLLRKAPKWIRCLMWGIVGLRLALPFSIESVLSLIPSAKTIPTDITTSKHPAIDSGINIVDNAINPIISDTASQGISQGVSLIGTLVGVAAIVWIVGVSLMLIYGIVSYVRLYIKVRPSLLLRDRIYYCDSIDTPFILGIIRPRIYVPSSMSEDQISYVSAHEYAHIKRCDHLIKPFGFLLLSVYWFNPVIWLAYILLCRDIEMACDEKVIKNMSDEAKRGYSETLVACSVHRRIISACPLAFGEVGVKDRIKSVLSYKKPAFWIILVAVIASTAIAVCFLTSPLGTGGTLNKIVKQRGYTLVSQEDEIITLSIDKSLLTNSIYSKEGKSFEKDEIIAYKNNNTTIYLKSIRYANEGNDKLYFCFDFSYDLPKKSGTLLYPYEILNNGIGDSVAVVDKVLRGDSMSYADAVTVRGQGSGTKIWFYVSTDAFKKLEGRISFDIKLNLVTYLKNGERMQISVLDNVHTDYEGVYITHKSTDKNPGDYYVINAVWHNDTDEDRTFGEFYTIEYKNGDRWESVDTKENRYWHAIAILLRANSTFEKSYTTQDFDISKPGTYRLRTEFYANDKKCSTWIEFEMSNDDTSAPPQNDSDGVYGSIKSIETSPNGTKILNVVWHNNTDKEVLFGEFFTVEFKDGDSWVNICTADKRQFSAIAIVIMPRSTCEKSYLTHEFDMSRQGTYRLRCDLGQVIFELGDKFGLDESANGEYDGAKIISGNNETIPLSSMLFASIYEHYGWLAGDGMGANAFFDSNGDFTKPIPTIRRDGNITLELGNNYSFVKMRVYDLEHNEIKTSGSSFDSLNDLSSGSYYVIMGATRVGDFIASENRHEETTNEYLFGIIVK